MTTLQSRPAFATSAEWPAIGSHRLLGDGRSVALLTPDGEVDWWCAPRPDSPPQLWSLLDRTGPAARWVNAEAVDSDGTPAGPALRSVLRIHGHRNGVRVRSRIHCIDALVTQGDTSTLVRLVRSEQPDVVLRHDACGAVTEVTAVTFEWRGVALDGSGRAGEASAALVGAAREAEKRAAALGRRSRWLPRHHPERAADALAVLRACTYSPTGAVVAAATTSLPEAVGGDRQFDYRYCWVRDAALGVAVASLLGERGSAEDYLGFMHRLRPEGIAAPPVYDVTGEQVPPERTLAGMSGWRDSRPVRAGNDARTQVQFDAWGLVVEAVSVHVQTGGRLDSTTWGMVRSLANDAADRPDQPSNGIWERRQAGPMVSGDIGRWLVLDRAIWIARGWRPWIPRRRWKKARRRFRARVLAAVEAPGTPPDAAVLMAVLFGLIDPRSDRARRIVDGIVDALGAGDLVYRYEPSDDDGFHGREGAFLPVTWWAIAVLALTGRLDEARARLDRVCARMPRLLAEQVDPQSGESLGNVPLVWSHTELARALYILDAETIRRRYGAAGLWVWRLARYVRLRSRRRSP
jgi:hypothetical protein